MRIALLSTLILIALSCRNEKVLFLHDNNNPKIINYYSWGDSDSTNYIQKEFYRFGELKYIASYVNNKVHGEFIEYWENGKVKLKKKYVNGVGHGRESGFHENGAMESDCNLIDGEIEDGEVISWYDNGQILVKYCIVDGKAEGEWFIFYKNGVLNEKGFNRNDTLVGEYFIYDENGKLRETLIYEKGEVIDRK